MTPEKAKTDVINRSSNSMNEKESPSVKSIRSPSFGSNMFVTPKKTEDFAGNNKEIKDLEEKNDGLLGNFNRNSEKIERNANLSGNLNENRDSFGGGEKGEIRVSFGEKSSFEKKDDISDKYLASQLNLQKNMEKYEEVINMNIELKKEKDEVFFIYKSFLFIKINIGGLCFKKSH